MADFQRLPQRFIFAGISASPADALAPGKLPFAKNVRSYEDGVIQPREGLVRITSGPVTASPISTLARMNDPTPFNGGVAAVRFIGAAGNLYRGDVGSSAFGSVDDGYSVQPYTVLAAQPPQSPRPYLYIANAQKMAKITTDGAPLSVGIAQPGPIATAPTVVLDALATRFMTPSTFAAAGGAATAPTAANRVTTTVGQIVYDNGVSGYASIVPVSFAGITEGLVLTVAAEKSVVTELTIAVAATTVAAIVYDSGTTGLCTIQPTGSLGIGQLEAPPLAAYQQRARPLGTNYAVGRGQVGISPQVDTADPVRRIRQVDFPVNSLIVIAGTQTVRILSVALAPDGLLSFRCSTTTTVTVGQTITGKAAMRMYLAAGHTAGQTIANAVKTNTIRYPLLPVTTSTTASNTTSMTGGLQGAAITNFAQFSDSRAILPDDVIHLALRVDRLPEVTSVRLFFALTNNDFLANSFLENYFMYEWRASDIIASIQATNAASVSPMATSLATVVTNEQLNPGNSTTPYQVGRGVPYDQHVAQQAALNSPTGATSGALTGAQRRTGTAATPPANAASTSQLGLGNNQWMDLRIKVSQLTRIGTDSTLTLGDVKAFQVLVSAAAVGRVGATSVQVAPLTITYGDIYIAGGYGPDVGDAGDPYVYAYRYRSSLTGAVSNPSPPNRGGVIPKRQRVLLTPTPSTDAQVDKIDWFRLGGSLTQFTYLGTGPNSSAVYEDTVSDQSIDGQTLAYDNFQPWATQDLPTTTVVNVAGTAIKRVSGDSFNTAWAAGSALIINGRACTLYASPTSGDLLHVNESVPFGSSVSCVTPGATKLSQPLQSLWGDFQGVWFACGDPDNPGNLYWTHGNNIECCRDGETLQVTSPSEPLQAGYVYNTFSGVFSSEDLYQIIPNSSPEVSRFRIVKTPCGRGLWSPWAMDVAPEGVFFLSSDGIYVSAGGSPAVSIVSDDLRAIFPNDGTPGASVNGILAPDMTQTDRLRLTYVSGYVYFDYLALDGSPCTLIFDTARKAWMFDTSALTGFSARLQEPGAQVFDQMLGGSDGNLYQYDMDATTDSSVPIAWTVQTQVVDAGQPRVTKQFGDVAVSINPHAATGIIAATPVVNDGALLPVGTFGAGENGRKTYVVNLPDSGYVARNLGLFIEGVTAVGDPGRPELYLWEPSFIPKADNTTARATDWDTLGYMGAKFVQGLVLTANTFGLNKAIVIQRDNGDAPISLVINHDGEVTKEYPSASQMLPGWTPFIAHQVRIVGADTNDWQMLGYRFVWEPHPELATQWETQFTTHDLPGYMWVRDVVIAHASEGDIRLRIVYDDGGTEYYTIPASGGTEPQNYRRSYVVTKGSKGRAVQYQLRSGCGFRLFRKDCSVRVGAWGSQGSYLQAMPFGGNHRVDGAAI